jgi:hypothetical protein
MTTVYSQLLLLLSARHIRLKQVPLFFSSLVIETGFCRPDGVPTQLSQNVAKEYHVEVE